MTSARIVNTYAGHGAKLIEAHGFIAKTKMKVPRDTVIMFLANPGRCMIQAAGRRVASLYFMNQTGLQRFFRSGGSSGRNVAHVSDILKRTHFAGESIPDTWLEFKDPEAKRVGFIKKLPLRTREFVLPGYYRNERAPTFAETTGPLNIHGSYQLLSSVLAKSGPGVYIVSACRVPQEKFSPLPMHTPHPSSWPYQTPVRGPRRYTQGRTPGVKSILKLPAPGPRNAQLKMEMAYLKKYSVPRNVTRNVVNHMLRNYPVSFLKRGTTRSPVTNTNLRKYIAPLPANTNVTRLRRLLAALKNGTAMKSASLKNKAMFLAYPSQRGQIVFKYF
jgi:hypothetical protein